MPKDYIEVTSVDNIKTWINKNHIGAIEEVRGTSRSEAYLKVYVSGYSFALKLSKDDFVRLITS